ncbi:MAG: hypothetical protein AAGA45_04015 [Verrucomicrobiota bacterium]
MATRQKSHVKKKVVKENVRRVVKWRFRQSYAPYYILLAIVIAGVAFGIYLHNANYGH